MTTAVFYFPKRKVPKVFQQCLNNALIITIKAGHFGEVLARLYREMRLTAGLPEGVRLFRFTEFFTHTKIEGDNKSWMPD